MTTTYYFKSIKEMNNFLKSNYLWLSPEARFVVNNGSKLWKGKG